MDRSAVGTSGGNTEETASGLQIAFPREDLTHQTWRVHRGAPNTEKLVRRRETRTNMGEHQQAPSAYLGAERGLSCLSLTFPSYRQETKTQIC